EPVAGVGRAAAEQPGVQAALALLAALPPPAPGALVLAGTGRAGAGRAADRGVALLVQRVHGQAVGADIGPDLLAAPVGQRVELDHAAVGGVQLGLGRGRAGPASAGAARPGRRGPEPRRAASSSALGVAARDRPPPSRRSPVAQAPTPARARSRGATLRTWQHSRRRAGSLWNRLGPWRVAMAATSAGSGVSTSTWRPMPVRTASMTWKVSSGRRPVSRVRTRTPGSMRRARSSTTMPSAWKLVT